jgi:spore germination protein KB
MFSLGSAVLILPSLIVANAKQDAWISILLSIVAGVIFVSLWNQLHKRNPGQSLVQICESLLVQWLGKLISIVYLWYFLFLSALVLNNVGTFISTNILVQTPMQFVNIIFMLAVIYGAYLGLEVLARTSEVLFPWVIMIYFITVLLLLNSIHLTKLLPILPEGWQPPIKGIYPLLGSPLSELVVFLVIIPFVNRRNTVKSYFLRSITLASLIGSLIMMISISVLGVDMTERSAFAVFDVAKEIRVGTFFERVEVLVGGIWITTVFVKLAVCFYAVNLVSAQLFRLKSYRATILPYGIFVIALSLLVHPNSARFIWFASGASQLYSLIHGLVIPAFLLAISIVRDSLLTRGGRGR